MCWIIMHCVFNPATGLKLLNFFDLKFCLICYRINETGKIFEGNGVEKIIGFKYKKSELNWYISTNAISCIFLKNNAFEMFFSLKKYTTLHPEFKIWNGTSQENNKHTAQSSAY